MRFLTLILLLPILAFSQKENFPSQSNFLAMKDTYQTQPNVYFKKGEDKPFTGVLYAKYDNGNMMSMQEHVDGKGNGRWINFNPDGSKSEEGLLVNNRVEGPGILYYDDGNIKATGNFSHPRKRIGEWLFYDREGNIVSRMTYTR